LLAWLSRRRRSVPVLVEEEVSGLVVAALDAAGVAYVLVGSLASSAHGFPRATNDADLVADLRRDHVDELVATLQEAFYIDAGAVIQAVPSSPSVFRTFR
jgi:hypothetical protein